MALELDGYPVEIDDRIYDIYDERWLTVRQVYSNRFMVEFKTAQGPMTRTYDYKGVGARRRGRTAYWHDPRIVIPAKGAENWKEQQRVLRSIVSDIAKLPLEQKPEIVTPQTNVTHLAAVQEQLRQDSPTDFSQSANAGQPPSQAERDAAFQRRVREVEARESAKAAQKAAQ